MGRKKHRIVSSPWVTRPKRASNEVEALRLEIIRMTDLLAGLRAPAAEVDQAKTKLGRCLVVLRSTRDVILVYQTLKPIIEWFRQRF